ncbi:hypothetical protein jhhlp_007178 [Lomentospora prolificans]|uniref:Deacetylase sirtuin-type domain-containing protein n=1 Tax=Lomentospora prolificans TaxID=41688 RepID=A0A2N3N1Y1_9PEZI|nr:hypothetical protein jhhlp_007178 [Lomentospora prolificans]
MSQLSARSAPEALSRRDDDCESGQISSPPASRSPSSLPSSPLSILSKSPSLPASPPDMDISIDGYPSPSATTTLSGSQSPIKALCRSRDTLHSDEICVSVSESTSTDGPPAAKKRRIAQPKPRTTEYLDLQNIYGTLEDKTSGDSVQLERLLKVLRKKKKIVVIAGAGISVSAGIPDFRSSSGLFATLKSQHKLKGSGKHLFDAAVYRDDSSTQSFHTMVRELAAMTSKAQPTAFHHLLASLAAEGRLMRLYTQNVDCIDTNMKPLATNVPLNIKGPWPVTIQLHGGLEKMVCTKCGELEPFDGDRFTSHEAPLCHMCQTQEELRVKFARKRSQGVGRIRPRIVLYNESNPDEDAIGNVSMADLRNRPDAVLVVGTSLKIPGVRRLVKEFCQVTRGRRDGFTAWINLDPEPSGVEFKDCWDLIVKGKCDDVAELAHLPRWDDRDVGETAELTEEELKLRVEMLRRSKLEVCLSPPASQTAHDDHNVADAMPKQVEQVQGIPTPRASPKLSAVAPGKISLKAQTKLSFVKSTSSVSTSAAKSTTSSKAISKKGPAKPRLPKSRRPKQATLPKNTVTDVFKTVKSTAPQLSKLSKKISNDTNFAAGGGAAVDSDTSSLTSLSSSPDFTDAKTLPDLRPARRASDDFVFTTERQVDSEADDNVPPSPTLARRAVTGLPVSSA